MKQEEDTLKGLFSQLPTAQPSKTFRSKLMLRLEAEALRKEKKQERIGWIIASLTSLLLMGIGILGLAYTESLPTLPQTDIELPDFDFETWKFYGAIGFLSLLLLMADDLVRLRLKRKKK